MGNQYTSQSRLNTELDSLVREVMKKHEKTGSNYSDYR